MRKAMYQVSIAAKRDGGSSVGLEKIELDRLIQDWRRYQTAMTDYNGFLWMGPGEPIVKATRYSITLRPSHITDITVDGVSVPYRDEN